MAYDTTRLDQLGAKRIRLVAQLKDVVDELDTEIPKARAAKVTYAEIMKKTGFSLSQVQEKSRPPERRRSRARASAE